MWSRLVHQQCWFYALFGLKTFLVWLCFIMPQKWKEFSGEKLLLHHVTRIMVASVESNFTLNCIPLNPMQKDSAANAISEKFSAQDFPNFLEDFQFPSSGRDYMWIMQNHSPTVWFNSVQLTKFRRGDKITFCREQIKLKINFDNAFHLAFLHLSPSAWSFLLVNFKLVFCSPLNSLSCCLKFSRKFAQ